MPTQRASPSVADLRRAIREHEELERRLYTALISDHITKKTDIMGELWNYAEQMAGLVPAEEDDGEIGFYYDD